MSPCLFVVWAVTVVVEVVCRHRPVPTCGSQGLLAHGLPCGTSPDIPGLGPVSKQPLAKQFARQGENPFTWLSELQHGGGRRTGRLWPSSE